MEAESKQATPHKAAEVIPTTFHDLTFTLGRELFTCDQAHLHEHAEIIALNPELRQIYIDIVLASRKIHDDPIIDCIITTAASNAISILNYGSRCAIFAFRFIDLRDWSGIRVPGANLNYALMAHCNLNDADLSGSHMRNITLCHSQLQRANLSGVHNNVRTLRKLTINQFFVTGLTSNGYLIGHISSPQGDLDHDAHVVSIETQQVVGTLSGLAGSMRILNISRDGSRLISGSRSVNILKVWDLAAYEHILDLQLSDSSTIFPRWHAAFSPNNDRVATIWSDDMIRVWDLSTSQVTMTFKHTNVGYIAWCPKSNRLASCSASGTSIFIWDLATASQTVVIVQPYQTPSQLQFSSDGSKLLCAVQPNISVCLVWDATTGDLVATLKGHSNLIIGLASDGRYAYSSAHDGIRIWDLETGACLETFNPHSPSAITSTDLVLTPDGRTLISHSVGEKLTVMWDVKTITSWQPGIPGEISHHPAQLSPDGRYFAVAMACTTIIHVYDVATGRLAKAIPRYDDDSKGRPNILYYSFDGRLLVYTYANFNAIYVWDIANNCYLAKLVTDSEAVRYLCFNPKTSDVLAVSNGLCVRLWDLTTLSFKTLCEGERTFEGVCFHPDGSTLAVVATGESDENGKVFRFVQLWDIISQECVAIVENVGQTRWPVISHCGRFIASPDGDDDADVRNPNRDRKVRLWCTKTGKCVRTINRYAEHNLEFLADGRIMAYAYLENSLTLVNTLLHRSHVHQFRKLAFGKKSEVRSFSANGLVVATMPWLAAAEIWHFPDLQWRVSTIMQDYDAKMPIATYPVTLATHQGLANQYGYVIAYGWSRHHAGITIYSALNDLEGRLEGHSDDVTCTNFSPSGEYLASGLRDGNVGLWKLAKKERIAMFEGHSEAVSQVEFSPTGELLASASRDMTIRIWNISESKCIARLEGHTSDISQIIFAPDGKSVASVSSGDPIIRIWDITTSVCSMLLDQHTEHIFGIQYSSEGGYLASGSSDDSIRVWEVKTGNCLATLKGHMDCLTCFAFTSDGKSVVSGSEDCTLHVWTVATGTCRLVLKGHVDHIRSVCLTPDNRCVISASDDTVIHVWDIDTGELLHELYGHTNSVTSIQLVRYDAKGDTLLVSTSRDGTVRLWTLHQILSRTESAPELRSIVGKQHFMNLAGADLKDAQMDPDFSSFVLPYLV